MATKKRLKRLFHFLPALLMLVLLFASQKAFAAGGTMTFVPSSGTHTAGSILSLDLKIDGGGTAFNAAQATIKLLPQANIQGLMIGDCGFSFIRTPTTSDPSFTGVILGSSTNSCTVYTLTLQVNVPPSQQVAIENASIKAYKDASELFSSSQNANFDITGVTAGQNTNIASSITPTQAPEMVNGTKFYTVSYNIPITSSQNKSDTSVMLDTMTPANSTVDSTLIPSSSYVLSAQFNNVPEGTHTITTYSGNKKIDQQIVYISGSSKDVAFGNSPQNGIKMFSPLWFMIAGLIMAGVIAIVGLAIWAYFYLRNKRTPENPPPQPQVTVV